MIALARERAADRGRPIWQWRHGELADEMVRRGIVESISPWHAWRTFIDGLSTWRNISDLLIARAGRLVDDGRQPPPKPRA